MLRIVLLNRKYYWTVFVTSCLLQMKHDIAGIVQNL